MGVRVHSGLGQTGRRGVVPTMLLGQEMTDQQRADLEAWQAQIREVQKQKAKAEAAGVIITDVLKTAEQYKAERKNLEKAAAGAPPYQAGIFDQLSAWGNQQMIPGIPNLYLATGALLAVMAMGGMGKMRRA